MSFSYKALKKVIKEEIVSHYDGVIEGGIGNNFDRYVYFRGLGYDKLYIGIDLKDPDKPVLDGLIHRKGNCFDSEFLASILNEYNIKNPVFVSNGALSEDLLSSYMSDGYYSTHIDEAAEALTRSFKKQLHIRPAGKFPITSYRVSYPENTDNPEYNRFMKFLEESRKRGWKENVVGRNIVLLTK